MDNLNELQVARVREIVREEIDAAFAQAAASALRGGRRGVVDDEAQSRLPGNDQPAAPFGANLELSVDGLHVDISQGVVGLERDRDTTADREGDRSTGLVVANADVPELVAPLHVADEGVQRDGGLVGERHAEAAVAEDGAHRDSSSLGPDVAASGSNPTVEAAGDASSVDDSSAGRVAENPEEPPPT